MASPVPHFDRHLSVLKSGYLFFFSERSIEELKALYKRMKQQDTALEIGMEYSQARAAWREVRESLDREIQSRTAFCTAVNTDVIRPLRELRDTQERTRQRIHEDMKESQSAYTDCAENQLPRAQKQYRRKCQEAEESRMAPAMPMPLNAHASSNSVDLGRPLFSPSQEAFSPPPSYANLHSPEGNHTHPAPNPAAATSSTGLVNVTSRGEGLDRARSPPPQAGPRAAIQDFTQHSKKGLNQLKSFLDGKRDVGGSLREGSERGNAALRNVRARREAEEADKEYRHVVYKLETLRRWRGNVIRAGFTSLETFMVDLSLEVTKVLQRYTDTLIATATTNTQFATQSQSIVSQVSPEREVLAAHQLIPEHISRVLPKRTLYQNYTYGDSLDLIFGFSLLDYAAARNLEDGAVPGLVAKAVQAVDERGLDSEGIYRISGRQAVVQDVSTRLIHRIERDEANFEFEKTIDVFCIASLLKRYLRELPEPLFKFPLAERLQHSAGRSEHIKNGFMMLRGKLRRLPGVHQSTMRVVIEHLARVAARSQKNKMDARNLSIVFSGVIFGEDEIPKGSSDLLNVGTMKDTVMEDLINYGTAQHLLPRSQLILNHQTAPMLFDENAHTRIEGVSPASSMFFYANATSGGDELPDYAVLNAIPVGPEKGEKAGSISGHSAKPSIHESQDFYHDEKEKEKETEKEAGKSGKEKEKEKEQDPAPHSVLVVRELPPEPVGEAPAKIDYGSSHTTVRVGDAPLNFSPTLPEVDFAPRLPPRPGKSIHPSSRAAALNPDRPQQQEGTTVIGNGPPPPLPARAGSVEAPALPPRRLASGVPSLDVRLPSPLPEMTFPRTPSPTPPTPINEERPSTPSKGGTTTTVNTPVRTIVSAAPTPVKTSNSPLRAMEKNSTEESPATAEFTTPVPSPMATRVTPSRTTTSDNIHDTSPRRSGEQTKQQP
ncbi:GTPase-activator protein for Rho-like GTPases [Rhizoctonia solani]|uniref:GTPase-activator protein for Rho-like GTPases n=1 Tax=Rhizoctonia solani TaxID=456999 RepID=A0A8H7HED9_9AGAM|nr:GTPase-activator protein for Rho-like GTPases [Rhizoctonia solani]